MLIGMIKEPEGFLSIMDFYDFEILFSFEQNLSHHLKVISVIICPKLAHAEVASPCNGAVATFSDPGAIAARRLGSARLHVADLRQSRRFHSTGQCCLLDEQHHLISLMCSVGICAAAWLQALTPIAAEQKVLQVEAARPGLLMYSRASCRRCRVLSSVHAMRRPVHWLGQSCASP